MENGNELYSENEGKKTKYAGDQVSALNPNRLACNVRMTQNGMQHIPAKNHQ
jgi:hypothetical protein